jgi:uncharacterized protein (DUF1501 family)
MLASPDPLRERVGLFWQPAPSRARRSSAGEDTLDFLERVESDARIAAESVRRALQAQSNAATYPAGYDTHFAQARPHETALGELDEAIAAFLRDLEHQRNLERVLVLTFSEFGRRVRENDCEGTDHGAAAPCLVFGGAVTAGLHGRAPSLAPRDLVDGDLRHTVDFRNVYATVLERWLRAPSERILGARFDEVDFLHCA